MAITIKGLAKDTAIQDINRSASRDNGALVGFSQSPGLVYGLIVRRPAGVAESPPLLAGQ